MKRWAWLAAPGMAWLAAFFLVAFYAIVAVGLGNVTDLYERVKTGGRVHVIQGRREA